MILAGDWGWGLALGEGGLGAWAMGCKDMCGCTWWGKSPLAMAWCVRIPGTSLGRGGFNIPFPVLVDPEDDEQGQGPDDVNWLWHRIASTNQHPARMSTK